MNETKMLGHLTRQAEQSGADLATIYAIIDQSSEAGARRALAKLGLSDDHAQKDLTELRLLLAAWRDAKKGAWKAAIDWMVKGVLAIFLIGLAVRFGLTEYLK
ncbi:hypothetical protein LPB140_11140 [Sphingorhabdus lutea]|uniref:Uncharacterized protein n=1 Tax=Sphingorhabdus lutea TaxID=1913578 RepID=A0A1L3JDQ1_9SPHN|nr:DUF6127 family protein [Sphingorhabdus lutea]APG63250.1 hypothetical protein LPB140_11140 [Sphingorhabdus lutea]